MQIALSPGSILGFSRGIKKKVGLEIPEANINTCLFKSNNNINMRHPTFNVKILNFMHRDYSRGGSGSTRQSP